MTSPKVNFTSQRVYKAHMQYADEKPEWMARAVVALNRWGQNEVTLQQAVAEAIERAHADGKAGTTIAARIAMDEPPTPTAVKRIIRRGVKP